MQNKQLLVILAALGAVALASAGLFLFLKSPAGVPGSGPPGKGAVISVEPPKRFEGLNGFFYRSGDEVVVRAKNLEAAELRYVLPGAPRAAAQMLGELQKTSSSPEGDTWVLPLPKTIPVGDFLVQATDTIGLSFGINTATPQCADGIDNDGDGKIDYPADPGCSSASDNDEADGIFPPPPPPPAAIAQCSDGIDNDGDGKIDYPADPGCASPSDNDETSASSQPPPTAAQCSDGIDNDGDGKVDFPADPGCSSASDNDETDSITPPPTGSVQCSDGIDNDGDGKIDYPADPGCADVSDNDEADPPGPPPPPPPSGKLYSDAVLGYQFYYPTNLLRTESGGTVSLYLQPGSPGTPYRIILGYLSPSELSSLGPTYCSTHPSETSRCETVSGVNASAEVDWGTGGDAIARFLRPQGGAVTLALTPVIPETQNNFRSVLLTFSFK